MIAMEDQRLGFVMEHLVWHSEIVNVNLKSLEEKAGANLKEVEKRHGRNIAKAFKDRCVNIAAYRKDNKTLPAFFETFDFE